MLEEDNFNSTTDNRELMVADYFNNRNIYTLSLISPQNIEVRKGKTFSIQVSAQVNGSDTTEGLTFISDDVNVASVSEDGIINGIDEGDTVIKAMFRVAQPVEVNVRVVEALSQYQGSAQITFIGVVPDLRVGGAARTYTARFFDAQGNPLPSSLAVWSIIVDGIEGTPTWLTVEKNSTTIRIQVQNDIRLIGRTINLRLTDAGGISGTVLRIPITSLT